MDLRQLRHAVVLARSGSFIRAAEELHITQSALSRSIQSLEEDLGVRLFERGRQGAQTTPEGRLLIERAEYIQQTLGGLRHDLKLSQQGELGEIGFGMGPMVAAVFMADLLTTLVREHPRLDVHASVNNADFLHDSLLAERIEFFIASAGQLKADPRIIMTPLGNLPLSLFVRKGHPLSTKKRLQESDLADYPLMTGTTPESMRLKERYAERRVRSLKVNISCDDFLTLKSVVQRCDAIWLTSRAVIPEEYGQGDIIELKTAQNPPMAVAKLLIVSLAGRKLSPPAKLVIKAIRGLFKHTRTGIRPAGRPPS